MEDPKGSVTRAPQGQPTWVSCVRFLASPYCFQLTVRFIALSLGKAIVSFRLASQCNTWMLFQCNTARCSLLCSFCCPRRPRTVCGNSKHVPRTVACDPTEDAPARKMPPWYPGAAESVSDKVNKLASAKRSHLKGRMALCERVVAKASHGGCAC